MGVEFEYSTSGPFFDGGFEKEVDASILQLEEELGQMSVNLIRQRLGQVLQHPSGRYVSRIQTERRADTNMITDGGVVYGPWLEGVGSRNATSRFKGYATFRQIAPEIEGLSQQVAENILQQNMGKL